MLIDVKFCAMRSFFKYYGILSIPLSSLVLFGQFGLRPNQIKYKFCVYFINLMLILGYLLIILGSCVIYILLKSNNEISNLYQVGITTVILPLYTIWIMLCYKKYNVFCLLRDIAGARGKNLHGMSIILVLISIFLFIGGFFCYHLQCCDYNPRKRSV